MAKNRGHGRFLLPDKFNFLGVVEAVYNPKTTDELSPKNGVQSHLIDDLAACPAA